MGRSWVVEGVGRIGGGGGGVGAGVGFGVGRRVFKNGLFPYCVLLVVLSLLTGISGLLSS